MKHKNKVAKLEARIQGWVKSGGKNKAGHEMHKPGSINK